MNERKCKQLFAAARTKAAPAPSADFEAGVLRAIRGERRPETPEMLSIFDQLNLLFPRLAWAAVAVMALSVAADFGLSAVGVPDLGDGVSQISAQWLLTRLLTPNGF
jgi:hypothetical protein